MQHCQSGMLCNEPGLKHEHELDAETGLCASCFADRSIAELVKAYDAVTDEAARAMCVEAVEAMRDGLADALAAKWQEDWQRARKFRRAVRSIEPVDFTDLDASIAKLTAVRK
jgi:hypothetical protein